MAEQIDIKELVKKLEAVKELSETQKTQKLELYFIKIILIGVVLFFSVSITTIILDYFLTRTTAIQSLTDKVNEQNIKVDLLFEELRKTNSELIELKTPKVK